MRLPDPCVQTLHSIPLPKGTFWHLILSCMYTPDLTEATLQGIGNGEQETLSIFMNGRNTWILLKQPL